MRSLFPITSVKRSIYHVYVGKCASERKRASLYIRSFRWLKAIPLRSPRCFASFYVVSDCLYIIGGASTRENATQSIDSIDLWDINDCVWREHANMSIARHGHSTGSIGQLFCLERYDISRGTFFPSVIVIVLSHFSAVPLRI